MLISDIVQRNAQFFGDQDAVVVPDGPTLSWADLDARSSALARAWLDLGLRHGDRVATFMPNCLEFYEFFFACAKSGLVGAPTNVRLAPYEIVTYLRTVEPAAILVHASLTGVAERFLAELPSIGHVIGVGAGHGLPLDLSQIRDAQEGADPGVAVREDDVFQLAATSGTTGVPKGAVHTHRTTLAGIQMWAMEVGSCERGTNLQVIPMFFNPGGPSGLHPVMLKGGRSVLVEPFDPGRCLEAIERYRVTHAIIVPTMLGMLLSHPDLGAHDYASLQGVGSGGSPVPRDLVERARAAFGDVVMPMYGMAETASAGLVLRRENIVTDGPEHVLRRLQSAGHPMTLMQARVVADDGGDVPRDGETPGEIWLSGDSICREYWAMPDETALSRDGEWLKTGDVGVMDGEGFVTIVDRKKDIIITGGINVFSRDIEEILHAHPAVAQVAVIGVPHERWGEAIHAVVVLEPSAHATVDELLAFAVERLAAFKKPRSLEIVDALPISGTGKILKKELRARYWPAVG